MSEFDTPQSRNEAILQNILGATNVLLPPQSRVEAILQAILNDTSYEPAPQSRIEELLLAIKDGGTFDDEARSRNEAILLAKLNGEEYTAEPQSRIEELLIEWANVPSWILKTVSGSVVSVDDAIAAPAEALTVEVVAWQEGSGDPSPVNDRPIHGFSVLNATRAGKNLFDIPKSEFLNGVLVGNASFVKLNIPYNASYVISTNAPTGFVWVGVGGDTSPSTNYRIYEGNPYTFYGNAILWIGLNKSKLDEAYNYLTQIEVGSIATDYEPYTGNIYTIDLNGTRAKGNVDLSSGLMKLSQVFYEFDGTENWQTNGSNGVFLYMGQGPFYYKNVVMCNLYKPQGYGSGSQLNNYGISFNGNTENMLIKDSEHITVDSFKQFISEHHLQVVCDLWNGVPDIEVQLTPTQIELLKNNNTLFADTGDLTLTYKAHE